MQAPWVAWGRSESWKPCGTRPVSPWVFPEGHSPLAGAPALPGELHPSPCGPSLQPLPSLHTCFTRMREFPGWIS